MADWNMPKMSGIDIVRAVRTQRAYDALPLTTVATNTELEHIDTALEAGAKDYTIEPFRPDIVREKLELLSLSKG
jgi:two-component system, chemotaxis family, chemotaxis protein CheY